MEPSNPELRLAAGYIEETGCNIFLTGKAGTGKTTFLHTLKKTCRKRMVVTAPTGVAALNAGGVTLHSFFQLPFGPFIPGGDANRAPYRFGREKIGLIKSLDLLVIDEISMVRADVLDAVDSVLRRFRQGHLPFGGAQLLMIGDLFQLPPVVRGQEWELLKAYYDSPYFFSSTALRQTDTITIELEHIYRQPEQRFIELLNRVRNDQMDPATLHELNRRHIPGYAPPENEGVITLCTHNRIADAINSSRLAGLQQKPHLFEAVIEGAFPEAIYPTARVLRLKTGAQVMFVRNDATPQKRYFNGKIGTITGIDKDKIRILCPEDPEEIDVEPATWDNVDYDLDSQTMEVTQKKIGAFTQYPLALAWAITIHKSQGLTFDKAVIDAQAAFSHGQVYVALSRCRTLDGMVLSTPLTPSSFKTDAAVCRHSEAAERNKPSEDALEAARIRYQQRLLIECFDFEPLRSLLQRLVSLVTLNAKAIHVSGVEDIRESRKIAEMEICAVGGKFVRQLKSLFKETVLPGNDPFILERLRKASAYFDEKMTAGVGRWIENVHVDTDNREIGQKIKRTMDLLKKETRVKLAAVKCCEKGFSPSLYFRAISRAEIVTPARKEKIGEPVYAETDIAHPELFETLKAWRVQKAKDEDVAIYQVLHQRSLIQIAVFLPDTPAALKKIWGIGKRLAGRYGEELLAMVADYRRAHNITEIRLPAPEKTETSSEKAPSPKADTKTASLELFEKGMCLSEIAKERGLVLSTIEGHMAHWVKTGRVPIDRLVPVEKRRKIEREIERAPKRPLGEIKQALGDDVSYGEIRLVLAQMKEDAPAAAL